MMEAGIYDQDLLVVDRSIEKRNHRVVIATLNGEFTVKRLVQDEEGIFLVAEIRSLTTSQSGSIPIFRSGESSPTSSARFDARACRLQQLLRFL